MRPSSCLPWQHEPTGPTRRILRWAAQGSYTTPRDTIARFAHLIARARQRTHVSRSFPPGLFSAPALASLSRKAERRPREPPSSTPIVAHFSTGQAPWRVKCEIFLIFCQNSNERRKTFPIYPVAHSSVIPATSPLLSGSTVGRGRSGDSGTHGVSCPPPFGHAWTPPSTSSGQTLPSCPDLFRASMRPLGGGA